MCSSVYIILRLFYYSLFAWIILSWIQVPHDHPIGQLKAVLDKFYERRSEYIKDGISTLKTKKIQEFSNGNYHHLEVRL